MERGVALARFSELGLDDLSEHVRLHKSTDVAMGGSDPSELLRMEEVERRYILHVLQAVAGNKTAAARILGIERKTPIESSSTSKGELKPCSPCPTDSGVSQ